MYFYYFGILIPCAARLIASLNALHAKLAHLETENGVARRRVRELEYELQQCKRDVARERTRIMEQDSSEPSRKTGEEQQRGREAEQSKYFEVVEEKKGLFKTCLSSEFNLTSLYSARVPDIYTPLAPHPRHYRLDGATTAPGGTQKAQGG